MIAIPIVAAVLVLWALVGFFFANFGYAAMDINHKTFLESRRRCYSIDEGDYTFMFIMIVLLPVGFIVGVCGLVGKVGRKLFG